MRVNNSCLDICCTTVLTTQCVYERFVIKVDLMLSIFTTIFKEKNIQANIKILQIEA